MKTLLQSVSRRLSALMVLMLVAAVQPLSAAVSLADAHAALASKNFQLLKTDTDALILSDATNQEAHVLRAIARVGLAAENDVPTFLTTKMGAKSAVIDLSADTTNVDVPMVFTYDTGASWTQSGSTYTLAKATGFGDATKPLICFENRGTGDYVMTLQLGAPTGSDVGFWGSLQINGQWGAGIDVYSWNGGVEFMAHFSDRLNGTSDPGNMTLTVTIPAGTNLTLEVGENSAGVRFTIVGTKPSTVVVLNGMGSYDSHPKFAAGANLTALFTLAAQEDTSVLAPMLADLAAVTSTDFAMTLPAAETGHPTDIVIQYPDVQLLIGFLKFNQGMRLLSKSYNWSFDLSGGLFMEATGPVALATKNSAFLASTTTSSAAERMQARTLLDAAAQCYVNADTAGLWTRVNPVGASYLFGVDTEAPDVADQRAQTLADVAKLRRLLTEDVSVFDVFPGFAADAGLPVTATFSLAPLFAATPISIRGVFPTFTDNGIQAGTSLKLLASGVLKGVDANTWEDYLLLQGITDPDAKVIETAPVFSTQPAGATVLAGDSQMFTALAGGYPSPTYQWKKNGVIIPGATGASYMIDSVQAADAAIYTVVATNSVANVARSTTSTAATLVVGFAPIISTQPVAQNVKAGVAAKFTVVATGNPLPKYQWRLNGTPITGATLASYTVTGSALTAGSYDVVVTNTVGSDTSNAVVLTVGIPPVITTKPVAQSVTAGQPVSLVVVASGSDPKTYQWKRNTVAINGATDATYTIDNVQSANAGSYIVTVTNDFGTISSVAVNLVVNVPPVITTQPVAQDVKTGLMAKFTVVATGNPLPKYQWRLNGTPITGATLASYSVAASVLKAGSYDVVVTNTAGSDTSDVAVLTVGIPPVITTKPLAQTVTAGQPVSLVVAASGSDTKTYQWKRNNIAINGATYPTYMIDNVQSANAGSYIVTVTNGYGTVSSTAVILVVKFAPVIGTQPISQSVKAGVTVKFSVVATANPLPMTYQWFKDDVKITGATAASYSVVASALKAGSYKVVVTNSVGSTPSACATLAITPP